MTVDPILEKKLDSLREQQAETVEAPAVEPAAVNPATEARAMTDDETKKLPTIQSRIITAGTEIWQDNPLDVVYQHSLFCQVVLPRSRPEGRVFERNYRHGSIRLESGALWDGMKWVEQPIPAGPKPRLALIHINSEAVRTHCSAVEVESSARKFMKRLGLNTDGGKDYNLFKREMKALAACRMTLGFNGEKGPVTVETKPIQRFEAWITNDDQPVLWPGTVELSQEYFDSLLAHAVPLDSRAVRALAHSALALDAYTFFARRLYTLEKPVKVAWHQFHAQFGQEYTGQDPVRDFKKEWIPACRAALSVYPSAKVEQIKGGLRLHPSLPPVHRESVAISHGLADHVRRSLPAPAEPKNLKPATVERFRKLYLRLDPYACKADFDAWLEDGKELPEHYDAAFLGFAKQWSKGKG